MSLLFNLARMSTSTTGTGTITLGSAVSGFLTFAGAGVSDGDEVVYAIRDGANSEIGVGTYTASGTTLTRNVEDSTNSGSAISLSGSAEVFITTRARDISTSRHNFIINPRLDHWQRGASFTSSGYTADRWRLDIGTGAAGTASRQAFTVGQTDVPDNPTYFYRFDRTTTGTGDSVVRQRIPSSITCSGQRCCLSFYMKGEAAFTMTIKADQQFGGGGSTAVGHSSTVSVTTSWQLFEVVFDMSSVSGKTIGTEDYVDILFQFPIAAGAIYFDFADVRFEKGAHRSETEWRSPEAELLLCQKFYEKSYNTDDDPFTSTVDSKESLVAPGFTGFMRWSQQYQTRKRTDSPTFQIMTTTGTGGHVRLNNSSNLSISIEDIGETHASFYVTRTWTAGDFMWWHWDCEDEI